MSEPLTYDVLIARIEEWARESTDVRLALVVGSRARTNQPHDQWSDLDVVAAVDAPERYLGNTDWIKRLGRPIVTVVEPTAVGGYRERRVLFENGLDVDFSLVPPGAFRSAWAPEVASVFQRGVKILIDKEGLADGIREQWSAPATPTSQDVVELVNTFIYQFVWAAKKLCRGELWAAKMVCDSGLKWQLLRMIEWHAAAVGEGHPDTWHNGRFFDRWAEPWILDNVRRSFATYDPSSVWHGLFQTEHLFTSLAMETAQAWGIRLPESEIREVKSLVHAYQETAIQRRP